MDVKKVKSVSPILSIKKPISKSILKQIIRLLHLILDISCKSWNSNIFKCPNTFGVPVDIDGITSEYKSYICCCFLRLREDQDLKQTGMAILDVGLLTGFSLAQNGVELNDLVRRVETPSGRVTLYLDTVSSSFIFMTTIIQYTCAKSVFCAADGLFGSRFWVHYEFMTDCMSNLIVFIRWPQWKGALKYPPSWTLRWPMSKMLWSWSTITMSPVRLLNNSSRSPLMHSYDAVCVSSSLSSAGRRTVRFYTSETRRDMSVCSLCGPDCSQCGVRDVWSTDGTPSINPHPLLALSLTTALVILMSICN